MASIIVSLSSLLPFERGESVAFGKSFLWKNTFISNFAILLPCAIVPLMFGSLTFKAWSKSCWYKKTLVPGTSSTIWNNRYVKYALSRYTEKKISINSISTLILRVYLEPYNGILCWTFLTIFKKNPLKDTLSLDHIVYRHPQMKKKKKKKSSLFNLRPLMLQLPQGFDITLPYAMHMFD